MIKVSEQILKALWDESDYYTINYLKQKLFYETFPNWKDYCSDKQQMIIKYYYLDGYKLAQVAQECHFKNSNIAYATIKQTLIKICKKSNISYPDFTYQLNKIPLDFTIEKLNLDYSQWEESLSSQEKAIFTLALGLSGETPLQLKIIAKRLNVSRQLTYSYYQRACSKVKQFHQNPVIHNKTALALILPIIRGNKTKHRFALEIGVSPSYYTRLELGDVEKLTPRILQKLTEFKPLQEYLEKLRALPSTENYVLEY
jgi:predicted DNA-binding protein YlxM (UPF0122 family)